MRNYSEQMGVWFEQILDSVEEAVHVVNCDGITAYYNKAAGEMDGLSPSEVIGRHVLDVYPSLVPETSSLLRVLESKRPILNQQQTIVTGTGKVITILYSTFPLYDNGRIVGAFDICRDITKIQDLAHRVTDLQAQLLDAKSVGYKKNAPAGADHAVKYAFNNIVGSHPSMVKLKVLGQRVAATSSPVLVLGETGVGKELVVQAIHDASPRKKKPFVAQNCAAFPATLLESILFGTVKGSFTGAEDRPGLFELVDGGTLFLDEINSMPMELQSKLLRVLQDGMFRRVGDNRTRQVDVRIIACCNVDPEAAVRRRELRVDLYYRLNVVSLHIPPLRERKSDIPALIKHFIEIYNDQIGCEVTGVSDEVKDAFSAYPWPGNVRELQHAIEYAMNIITGKVIQWEHLPERLRCCRQSERLYFIENEEEPETRQTLPEIMKTVEKKALNQALKKCGGNISQAALYLGIPRQTIQYKLKIHGLLEECEPSGQRRGKV